SDPAEGQLPSILVRWPPRRRLVSARFLGRDMDAARAGGGQCSAMSRSPSPSEPPGVPTLEDDAHPEEGGRGVVRAHLALLTVSCIWGLSYLGTKIALHDLGPFQMATVRTLIAAVLFLPAFVATRGSVTPRQSFWLGTLGIVAYFAAFNIG